MYGRWFVSGVYDDVIDGYFVCLNGCCIWLNGVVGVVYCCVCIVVVVVFVDGWCGFYVDV